MRDLGGKVALISGGTSGVGLEVAARLATRGARVVVTGRSEMGGAHALEKLRLVSDDVYFKAIDARDHNGFSRVVDDVLDGSEGGLDYLVSAGASRDVEPMPMSEMTPEQLVNAFECRFYPKIVPIHASLPSLRRSGGSVVILTTDAARHATSGEAVIGAAGAALILMTKTLARELARWQVRVNCVAMTLTSGTRSWDRVFEGDGFQSRLFQKALSKFPSGRAPAAGDVADVATFLAADALQVTGQTVSVNGGLSFGGW